MRWLLLLLLAVTSFASIPAETATTSRRRARRWSPPRSRLAASRDPLTLAAMREVPRHLFVGEPSRRQAYEDHPIPIGHGQTISQPYIVAFMTEALRPARRRDRARGGHRLRLPGGRAVADRRARLHDRDRGAPRGGGGGAPEAPRLRERARPRRRRLPGLAGGCPVRRDHGHRCRAAHPGAAARSS